MLTPAPATIAIGVTPASVLANITVIDAATGVPLERVLSADAIAGKVSRLAVEDGNLVREGNTFKLIDEDRAIHIEWITPPVEDEEPAAAVPAGGIIA